MNYTLTDAEFALLERISGGQQFNFAEDPTLDVNGRFKSKTLYANMTALMNLINRFKEHDAPSPPTVPVPPTAVPTNPPTINLYEVLPWFDSVAGTIYCVQALADGFITCSALDGDKCYATKNLATDPDWWEWGNGGTTRMAIKKDEFFYFKRDGAAGHQMRASLMP